MARVTSSSTRSKRKTSKPITSAGKNAGKNPKVDNRQQRQSSSTAKVTKSGGGTPGSARVTTGRAGAQAAARQPRAITNGNNPAMRQLRAKAVQAKRQAEGKPVRGGAKGKAVTLPNSAAQGRNLPREGAQRLRTIGDSGQTRAAQARGAQAVRSAQAKRGAKAASAAMTAKLKKAAIARAASSAGKAAIKPAIVAKTLDAGRAADGTLTAAQRRGDYKPNKGPAVPERLTQKGVDKKSFDDAFRQARNAKAKTFTWRGKKYTTEVK